MRSDELMHHGIMGMHWGIRRYQPYPKGYTGDGKFLGRKKVKHRQKKIEHAKRDIPVTVEEVINSGNPALIVANQSRLSYSQLQEAYNRANVVNNLNRITPKTISKGEAAFNKAVRAGKITTGVARATVNTTKEVANAVQAVSKAINKMNNAERDAIVREKVNSGDMEWAMSHRNLLAKKDWEDMYKVHEIQDKYLHPEKYKGKNKDKKDDKEQN